MRSPSQPDSVARRAPLSLPPSPGPPPSERPLHLRRWQPRAAGRAASPASQQLLRAPAPYRPSRRPQRSKLSLQSERYHCSQLGGCAIRDTAFAAGEKIDVAEVIGQWVTTIAAVAKFSAELDPETGNFAELSLYKPRKLLRDVEGVVAISSCGVARRQRGPVRSRLGTRLQWCGHVMVSPVGDVKEIAAAYQSWMSETT